MRLIISRTYQLQSAEERNGKIDNKIQITATHMLHTRRGSKEYYIGDT